MIDEYSYASCKKQDIAMLYHLISLVKEEKFNHFVTIAVNPSDWSKNKFILNELDSLFSKIQKDIDAKLFGSRFYKVDSLLRTAFISFPEHVNSNIHFHLLMRIEESKVEKFYEIFEEVVKKYFPAVSIDIQKIDNDVSAVRIPEYILKSHLQKQTHPHIIISPKFKLSRKYKSYK